MGLVWVSLPNLVLIEIFSYLNHNDRIRASSVCKAWRPCLFYPKFWSELKLYFTRDKADFDRSYFFVHTVSHKYLKKLTVTFEIEKFYVEFLLRIVILLKKNTELCELRLVPLKCIPLEDVSTKSVIYETALHFRELLNNAKKLKYLDLGYMESFLYYASELGVFQSFERPSCNILQQLNIATLREDCDNEIPLDVNSNMFYLLRNITNLSLDYDYLSDDILHIFCHSNRVPLNKLCLMVQGVELSHPGTTNESWKTFVLANPNCQLEMNVVRSGEAVALLHSHILQPSMPLTKLATYFCEQANKSALDVLSQWYDSTLQTLCIVDPLFDSEEEFGSLPHLLTTIESIGTVDPLVMIAWKCCKLESITLIGYQYSDIGLIGIARLCGPKLRELNIPDSCIAYDIETNISPSFLTKAISEALQKNWRPIRNDELDAVIINPSQYLSGWDSYVLNHILNQED